MKVEEKIESMEGVIAGIDFLAQIVDAE